MANPIGRLQEMCTVKRWTPPKYETHTEEGEPHKKNFVMACTVGSLSEVGEGSSKKVAKRRAAQKILKLLKSQEDKELDSLFMKQFANDLKDLTLEKMTPNVEQEQEKFRRAMRSNNTPAVQDLKSRCIHSPEMRNQLKDLLKRVSEENAFRLIECPLEEKSSTGKCMFMLEMTTVPIGVCTGRGETMEEAEIDAILGSLDFIKLIVK